MTCLGVLNRRDRDKDNTTGLKEGGVIEIETTVLSIYAMLASLRLKILLHVVLNDLHVVLHFVQQLKGSVQHKTFTSH